MGTHTPRQLPSSSSGELRRGTGRRNRHWNSCRRGPRPDACLGSRVQLPHDAVACCNHPLRERESSTSGSLAAATSPATSATAWLQVTNACNLRCRVRRSGECPALPGTARGSGHGARRLRPVPEPAQEAKGTLTQGLASEQGRQDDREAHSSLNEGDDFTEHWVQYPDAYRSTERDDAHACSSPASLFPPCRRHGMFLQEMPPGTIAVRVTRSGLLTIVPLRHACSHVVTALG